MLAIILLSNTTSTKLSSAVNQERRVLSGTPCSNNYDLSTHVMMRGGCYWELCVHMTK